jgi:FMN phosphatase YigB (HAD superfamily)
MRTEDTALDDNALSTLKTRKARGFQLGIMTNRYRARASFEVEGALDDSLYLHLRTQLQKIAS